MTSVLLLIHPVSGDAVAILPGEGELARALVLDGFNPIGPRGRAEAEEYRRIYREAREVLVRLGANRLPLPVEDEDEDEGRREVRDGEW